jgi:hypothetical protein
MELLIHTQCGLYSTPSMTFQDLIDEEAQENNEQSTHGNTTKMIMEEMSYVEYITSIEKYIAPHEELTSFADSIKGPTQAKDQRFTKNVYKIDDIDLMKKYNTYNADEISNKIQEDGHREELMNSTQLQKYTSTSNTRGKNEERK